MSKIKIIPLIFLSFLLLIVAMPAGAEYQIIKCGGKDNINSKTGLVNDCNLTDFQNTLVNVSKIIMGLSGSIALLLFVYGGFTWLVSSGNKEMVNKGRNILIAAVVGLVIVFLAFSAVEFTIRALNEKGDNTLFDDQVWNEPAK